MAGYGLKLFTPKLNGFWLSNTTNIPFCPGFSGLLVALPKKSHPTSGGIPSGDQKMMRSNILHGSYICSSGELLTPCYPHEKSQNIPMKSHEMIHVISHTSAWLIVNIPMYSQFL